jgi:myo-inositol-1(or 4)-monophosphatase
MYPGTVPAAAPTPASGFDLPRLLALKDALAPEVRSLGHWARDFALRAGAGEGDLEVTSKTTPGDVVTFADAEVQRRLATLLAAAAPEAGLVGEEGLDASTPDAPTWVIDPIDGTHNYVRGYPGFCVSVGLVVAGESLLGIIYDSVDDAVYWAVAGGGAWRDGVRLHAPPTRPMAQALIGTNFTAESAGSATDQRVFAELARRAAGVRSSGSACRDWCMLASGRSDLFWQFGLKAWDVAAGVVLVREAGGAMTFADGPSDWVHAPGLAAFAGQPGLVDEAIAVWRGAGGG